MKDKFKTRTMKNHNIRYYFKENKIIQVNGGNLSHELSSRQVGIQATTYYSSS